MTDHSKCSICGKPATVHFTQVIDGKLKKVDFCEEHAQQQGVPLPEGFDALSEVIAQIPEAVKAQVEKVLSGDDEKSSTGLTCSVCGMAEKDFKKLGRLGCPHCYISFAPIIDPMVKEIHGENPHVGKIPAKSLARRSFDEALSDLRKNLDEAIKTENYEDAAIYRDQIRKLEEEMATSGKEKQ